MSDKCRIFIDIMPPEIMAAYHFHVFFDCGQNNSSVPFYQVLKTKEKPAMVGGVMRNYFVSEAVLKS